MTETAPSNECPHCGHSLTRDVLTGELRPCTNCGSMIGSINEKAEFEPEHLDRLRKQKIFEIGIVVTLIVVGVVYLSTFAKQPIGESARSTDVAEYDSVIESRGYAHVSDISAGGKAIRSFRLRLDTIEHEVFLVAPTDSESVEAFILSASVPAGDEFPKGDAANDLVQKSFNLLGRLAESLLPTTKTALEKAIATTTPGKGKAAHEKGVAQTTDGWKVTYIMYRSYEDDGSKIPLLLFIFQQLDAASNIENETFNRYLYAGVNDGKTIQAVMNEFVRVTEGGTN